MAVASKKNALSELNDIFSTFTETKQNDFSRLCSRLLNENFIYCQIENDKDDYYRISNMRDAISDYFSLIDYTLNKDDQFKIFYLVSDTGRNTVKFKKLDTIILLILRLFYYQKSKETGNINIFASVGEIYSYLNKTGVYDQEQKKSSIIDSLLLMKRYKILDYKATDITMDTQIRVFPTIIHVVNSDDIDALEKKICSYRKTEDIENEDF